MGILVFAGSAKKKTACARERSRYTQGKPEEDKIGAPSKTVGFVGVPSSPPGKGTQKAHTPLLKARGVCSKFKF